MHTVLLFPCDLAQPGQALREGELVLGWNLFGDGLLNRLEKAGVGHDGILVSRRLHFPQGTSALEGCECRLGSIALVGLRLAIGR